MLEKIQPHKLVLAHMGGWGCWDQVEEHIVGKDVWLDTAFSLLPIRPAPGTQRQPQEDPPLSRQQFLRMVRRHGADRILFGTDSPWENQAETLAVLRGMELPEGADPDCGSLEDGLTSQELSDILGNNGARLLPQIRQLKREYYFRSFLPYCAVPDFFDGGFNSELSAAHAPYLYDGAGLELPVG